MLLETITALIGLLDSVNLDSLVSRACRNGKVTVLTSEKYRENIALQEKDKNKKINYPIIVVHDQNIDYDTTRFYNDNIQFEPYADVNYKGENILRRDVHYPLMPYNLNYRIEIICKQRIQLDAILVWVMRNIPDRGCIDVPYKDVNEKDCIYNALTKRGPIVKADEGTSSVLYRRVFELRITTLLDGGLKQSYVLAEDMVVKEKEGEINGKSEGSEKYMQSPP